MTAVWVSHHFSLTSEEVEEMGEHEQVAPVEAGWTGPDTKALRACGGRCEWGTLAGGPWKDLGLALLLLGVLHLINNSAQDGLSCWSLCPFRSANSLLLLVPLQFHPPSPACFWANVSPGYTGFPLGGQKRMTPSRPEMRRDKDHVYERNLVSEVSLGSRATREGGTGELGR